jgi:hypothetical protein
VRHADEKKTVWEFVCPSKRCAVEWHQKIMEAMDLLREFHNSGFQSTPEFYRFKRGGLGSGSHFQSPPIESPPREFPRLDPTPPPQNNFNFRVNHDDEVSRSVYDNSGPKASPNKFANFSSDVNYNNQYSPVKNQYEVNYQANQHSPQQGLNVNANYQGSVGGSTFGSSGRSYTVSSSSSLGRYPMGMPLGGQQPLLNRGNSQGSPSQNIGNVSYNNNPSYNNNSPNYPNNYNNNSPNSNQYRNY